MPAASYWSKFGAAAHGHGCFFGRRRGGLDHGHVHGLADEEHGLDLRRRCCCCCSAASSSLPHGLDLALEPDAGDLFLGEQLLGLGWDEGRDGEEGGARGAGLQSSLQDLVHRLLVGELLLQLGDLLLQSLPPALLRHGAAPSPLRLQQQEPDIRKINQLLLTIYMYVY